MNSNSFTSFGYLCTSKKNHECSARTTSLLHNAKLDSARSKIDHQTHCVLPRIPPARDQANHHTQPPEFVSSDLWHRCQSNKRLRPFRPVREHRLCQPTSGALQVSFDQRLKA